ncbi:radical SAM protein [Cohnella xylanilytica]|uniref:radical SAM/SPASM domain-containing protein n=1 Tax=Cohnella xylanilytica TaxID=557555 RepID=UPI001B1FE30A|nr:radical SAM protein [Cohnella xylanilytica]GIO16801.1 radical SAM protein [Cohnella xylanilytica]
MWTNAGALKDDKLVDYVRNLNPQLRQLTIFPSEICNYRCSFCHIWGDTGWALKEPQRVIREQLDIEVLKRFIDQVAQTGNKVGAILTGGEIMLYRHFEELVSHLRSRKMNVYVNTNGSLMKNRLPFLIENTVVVNVSIDGPEEYHDAIRGKGSFRTICDNIEALMAEKKRRKKMFPFVSVNMVLSTSNYHSARSFIPALRERFKDYTVVLHDTKNPWQRRRDLSVNFSPLLYTTPERGQAYAEQMKEHLDCHVSPAWQGFVEESIPIDTEALKRDLQAIWAEEGVDYSEYVDIHDYYTDIDNVFGRSKCVAPWHELIIRRTGDVYPCVDLPDYKLGNIYENSLAEIWQGERAVRFRDYLLNDNLMMCNRCTRLFADPETF